MKKLIRITWWAILIGAGLSVGYLTGQKGYQDTAAMIVPLQNNIQQLREKNGELEQALALKNTELETQQATLVSINQTLTLAQNEAFELRKELAFFQKILAPELMVGGVAIDSLTFSEVEVGLIRYRLVLVQLAKEREHIKGTATFTITGQDPQQQTVTADLATLALNNQPDMVLDFTYFQILEGDIRLPDGMQAADVKLSIDLAGANQQAQSWSAEYPWSQVYVAAPTPEPSPEPSPEPTPESSPEPTLESASALNELTSQPSEALKTTSVDESEPEQVADEALDAPTDATEQDQEADKDPEMGGT
ncbi:DUF6776 family protein [Motilimonas eburnea]|uniref:DUF6776 family protein n=1 Tax=Motilimonas eburnea TaxID=1737488 RepID=UPI001E2B9534|nr:DUF6776 family protein [Motilimonas eburnea]MCE2570977.1 hypothetical protein [Motilimonas eburnea]